VSRALPPARRSRRPGPRLLPALLGIALLVLPRGGVRGAGPGPETADESRARRPVALSLGRDGARLYVADAGGGSLLVVDPAAGRVTAEPAVGRGLADVAPLPDGRHLLAVDRAGDALLLLEARGDAVRVVARRGVAPDPVGVAVMPDGSACVVASTGSRRLTFLKLAPGPAGGPPGLETVGSLDLPFGPRCMAPVRDGARLVVADAYGGGLAVVDPARGVLESARTLPARNLRGLALSPDGRTLAVACLSLGRGARSTFQDVHWGLLVGNHLHLLEVEAVVAPGSDADLLRGGRRIDLGRSGTSHAAADPGALAFDPAGGLALALAGVDEVALAAGPADPPRRVGVGRLPSAVALSPDGRTAYVADALDGTISVIDVVAGRRTRAIPLGPRPEPDAAGRGERLFSDARLALDGWMSCQSCHPEGRSNGGAADTLGDGSYGAPKQIPSLLGVGVTGPWSWLGSADRLEDQVRKSVAITMQGPAPSAAQVADLTAYLRSLGPPRPAAAGGPAGAIDRGRGVFGARKCAGCHAPPEYTTPDRYDVGLEDEAGNREFNPPSLRGVGGREPLLHDGRASTLGDVFRLHRHPRGAELSPGEVLDLVAFLGTL